MPGKEKNQNTEEMCMEGKNFERRKAGEDKLKEKDPLAWEEIRTDHIIQDEWIDFRKISERRPTAFLTAVSMSPFTATAAEIM